MSSNEIESWYLATAKRKQEFRAVEQLANQGIMALCPEIFVEKLVRGKKKLIKEALFSGYLFVNLSTNESDFSKVRSTRGVRDWVRFGSSIAKIPIDLIDDLERQLNNPSPQTVVTLFSSGDKVRVLSGPFAGLEGVFEESDGESRALILIEFLGNSNHLSVANEQISSD